VTVKVSRIRESINEFKVNVIINTIYIAFPVSVTGILVLATDYSTSDYYTFLNIAVKMFILFGNLICGSLIWCLPLVGPLYGYIFDRKAYLEKWTNVLKEKEEKAKSEAIIQNKGV
jgi:hypothetical protein